MSNTEAGKWRESVSDDGCKTGGRKEQRYAEDGKNAIDCKGAMLTY